MADKARNDGIIPFRKRKYANKPLINFGNTIREYRLKANMEQSQLGNICGVSANAVSNWECGLSRPDLAIIPKLCETLEMPISVFFGLPNESTLSHDESYILANFRLMTKPNQKQLKKTSDAIIDSQVEARQELLRNTYLPLTAHYDALAAGFGPPLDDESETYPIFVRDCREARKADDVFPVNGQSMEPDYPNGSRVFVERVDVEKLSFGDVIACIADGVPYVKIYERDGLHSINEKYETISISEDDNVRLFGRVVGIVPEEDIASEKDIPDLMNVFADELR